MTAHIVALSKAKQTIKSYSFWIVVFISLALVLYSSGILDLKLDGLTGLTIIGATFTSESLIDTILASLATIIAIYFSISILAVQNAASNYTASILEYYKQDRKSWFTYFYLVTGLCLSGFMLNQEKSSYMLSSGQSISLLNVATVFLVTSFFVLAAQFLHIYDLLNPRTLILNAKRASIRDIRKVPARVATIQGRGENRWLQKFVPAEFFRRFLFHEDESTLLKTSHEKLMQIIDIVYKCAMKREAETYSIGLSAIAEIAESYVPIRKNDLSPEDKFLEDVYGKLLSVSKIAFDNKDTPLLQEIIKSIERVGISTAQIKPLGGANHSTGMAIWHVNELGEEAIERGLWDGAAQCVRSIREIGIQSLRRSKDESLASNRILNLGKGAVAGHEWFLTYVSLGALSDLLFQAVESRSPVLKDPASILEAIEQLATLALNQRLNESAFFSIFPIVFENSIGRIVHPALKVKNEEHDRRETGPREAYAKEVMSGLLESIHKIGVVASKNQYSLTQKYIIDCIAGITELLFKEKFIAIKSGFREELLKGISALGSLYFTRTGGVQPWFVWGGESALTNLAFAALSEANDEISTACEKTILAIGSKLIELDKYGYDSPRLTSLIAVIGVYAVHKSNKSVVRECVNDLAEFDKKYMEHSPSPQPMLHIATMREAYEKSKEAWRVEEKWEETFSQVKKKELKSFERLYQNARRKLG